MQAGDSHNRHIPADLEKAMRFLRNALDAGVALYDETGNCLYTCDGDDSEIPLTADPVSARARRSGRALSARSASSGDTYVYLPLPGGVLRCNVSRRLARGELIRRALEESLPDIAKVVGGEAVVFDREGKRIASVNPDGSTNHQYIGKVSKYALEAMRTSSPRVGRSMSMVGAMAVRIPLTSEFGMGFNNQLSVRQKSDLLNEIKKHRNVRFTIDDIIGESPAIMSAKRMALQAARSNSTVLLSGETGTGKELFAQAIHHASERRDGPFLALNCPAVPATLTESTLFGYEKGAFTGARQEGQYGVFEIANGGTLFLDEISEMEIGLQSKLLRVLQEREFLRVGGTRPISVDTRIVASTNRDLRKMVREGKFREDLYYRLNVMDIRVPPLRERTGDIELLARFFVEKHGAVMGKRGRTVSAEAMRLLNEYDWPGNVRELQNYVERALNWLTGDTLLPEHLPPLANKGMPRSATLSDIVKQYERAVIVEALASHNSRKEAARSLGLSVTTLWRKAKALGIEGGPLRSR